MIYLSKFSDNTLKNSLFAQAIVKIFGSLISIFVASLVARYLGSEKLGKLFFVLSVIGILSPISSLGIKGGLTAALCKNINRKKYIQSALILEIVGRTLVPLAFAPLIMIFESNEVLLLYFLACIWNIFLSFEAIEVVLFNQHQGRLIAKVEFLGVLLNLCFVLFAVYTSMPIYAFVVMQILNASYRFIALLCICSETSLKDLLRPLSREIILSLFKCSKPLILVGLTISLYTKIDQLMIQWISGFSYLAYYTTSISSIERLCIFGPVLFNTFASKLSPEGISKKEYIQNVVYYNRLAWLMGSFLAVIGIVFMPSLIMLLYGDEYSPASKVIYFFFPTIFAMIVGGASGVWLNVNGHTDIMIKRAALGAAINIALNLVLIPRYNIYGAAVSTSIAYIASVYIVGVYTSKTKGYFLSLLLPFSSTSFFSSKA
ncbi:oligosaccharide flippase family protein [Synechococcus sp. MIT S9503]|uniref:oligosaccharide flippase family protein n=1 Tax=Synechococcus sp. MIT S9503 TaxID=3082547 RepID=UPI0039A55FCD